MINKFVNKLYLNILCYFNFFKNRTMKKGVKSTYPFSGSHAYPSDKLLHTALHGVSLTYS